MAFLALVLTGFAAGISAGIFGIGGGLILVPVLVFFLKYPQHMANGTSLVALLAPVGLLGAIEYYRAGRIGPDNIRAGFIIALGMFIGTYFGSRIAIALPGVTLRKTFAVLLVFSAVRLWFKR